MCKISKFKNLRGFIHEIWRLSIFQDFFKIFKMNVFHMDIEAMDFSLSFKLFISYQFILLLVPQTVQYFGHFNKSK